MCDCAAGAGLGWKGWCPIPPPPLLRPKAGWIDLSHSLSPETPRVPLFPRPVFERFYSLPEQRLNVTRMEMIVHIGTHIDSPRHFFLDGPALEDIPLERMSGRGVIWPVLLDDADLIEPRHLDGLQGLLNEGDILLLNTGWHRFVGTPQYDDQHPSLSLAAADWIVEHRVKLVGFDIPTPDLPVSKRSIDFDYPIHRRLLSQGVMIAEHLTNLTALNGRAVEVVSAGLNIVGADGAPARIMVREIDR